MLVNGYGEKLLLTRNGRLTRDARSETGDSMPIPHVISYASIISGAYHTYYHGRQDEAMRHAREDALVMQRDCFLMGLVEERMRHVSTLKWQLTVPDEDNPDQVMVRDHVKTTLENMTGKDRSLRRIIKWGLWKLWYGRYAAQIKWRWENQAGLKTLTVGKALPINGDKIIYRWSHTPAVEVNAVEDLPGAEYIPATNEGARALLLKGSWRNKFAIFTADQEDSDFFDIDRADAIHGVGIRSKVFWLNWIRLEWASRCATFFDSLGTGGFLVFFYEQGNAQSEENVAKAAEKYSGFTKLLIPRSIGDGGAGVEFLPVNMTGVEALTAMQDVIRKDIQRYIVGQEGSGEATSGGGVGNEASTEFRQATKWKIAKDDSELLAEELTGDAENPSLVYMIQTHTFPESAPWKPTGFPLRLRFSLENEQSKEKLEAAKSIYEMGVTLPADELREAGGFSKPGEGDETVGGPDAAQKGGDKGGGFSPGGDEEWNDEGNPEPPDQHAATSPDQYADAAGHEHAPPGSAEGGQFIGKQDRAAKKAARLENRRRFNRANRHYEAMDAAYVEMPSATPGTKLALGMMQMEKLLKQANPAYLVDKDQSYLADTYGNIAGQASFLLSKASVQDTSRMDAEEKEEHEETIKALQAIGVQALKAKKVVRPFHRPTKPPGDKPVQFAAVHDVSDQPRDEQGRWKEAGAAMKAAHPFPKQAAADLDYGKLPPAGPERVKAIDAVQKEHSGRYYRAYIAHLVHRLHNEPAPKQVPLPPETATPGQRKSRARKAIEAATSAKGELEFLGDAWKDRHEEVMAVHPAGEESLKAARVEAESQHAVALMTAKKHIAGLPEDLREKAWESLGETPDQHAATSPEQYVTDETGREHAPAGTSKGGEFVSQGAGGHAPAGDEHGGAKANKERGIVAADSGDTSFQTRLAQALDKAKNILTPANKARLDNLQQDYERRLDALPPGLSIEDFAARMGYTSGDITGDTMSLADVAMVRDLYAAYQKKGKSERDPRIGTFVSKEVHAAAVKKAKAKLRSVVPPTEQEKAEAAAGLAKLGANKYRKNLVGNSSDRRKRREKLLAEFGDGKVCPCVYCGEVIGDHTDTLEQDKIQTTAEGGRYRLNNLVPACKPCNNRRSDMPFSEAIKKVTKYAGIESAE
jgi:hypothetical protein